MTHPSSLIFVDETGWATQAQLFGVIALRIDDPSSLIADVARSWRSLAGVARPRWADLKRPSPTTSAAVRWALQAQASDVYCHLSCRLLDRRRVNVSARYGSPHQAYIRLVVGAVSDVLGNGDQIAAVIADRFSTPSSVNVERAIKDSVNAQLGSLAVVGAQRVGSSGVIGLELADLTLGAITYACLRAGLRSRGPRANLARAFMRARNLDYYLGPNGGLLEVNNFKLSID